MSELHVIFGTGPLGKWTGRELIKDGQAGASDHRLGKTDRLPEGAEIVAGDAYDVNKNIELTKGATAIYQCAQPLYFEWAEKFLDSDRRSCKRPLQTNQNLSWLIIYICTVIRTEHPSVKKCLIRHIRRKVKSAARWRMR